MLLAPTNVIDGSQNGSLDTTPIITWQEVELAVSYEIAIGTRAGGTDVHDWTNIGESPMAELRSLSLENVKVYYASIRAVDVNGAKGPIAYGDGWQNLVCPENWVKVPGEKTQGLGGANYVRGTATRYNGSQRVLSDFCVMKYEAKLHDGTSIVLDGNFSNSINYNSPRSAIAVSSPDGQPWVYIKRTEASEALDAERACSNITGTGLVSAAVDDDFALINNSQWQAIARNIEANPNNWVNGKLNAGNTQSNLFELCDGYIENATVDCTIPNPLAPHDQKRTHELTNGEVIWDMGGNVYEWVIDDVGTGLDIEPTPNLSNTWLLDFTAATCGGLNDEECFGTENRLMFGPANSALSSAEGIGNFSGGFGSYLGAIYRGPDLGRPAADAGIFYTQLYVDETEDFNSTSFRCVWAP